MPTTKPIGSTLTRSLPVSEELLSIHNFPVDARKILPNDAHYAALFVVRSEAPQREAVSQPNGKVLRDGATALG